MTPSGLMEMFEEADQFTRLTFLKIFRRRERPKNDIRALPAPPPEPLPGIVIVFDRGRVQ